MLLLIFYTYCEYKKTPCTFLIYTFFLGEIDVYISKNKNRNQLRYMPYLYL